MSIDAMKQALEALEMLAKWEHPASNITTKSGRIYPHHVAKNSATTLRLAIEQAEKQEPVAWQWLDSGTFRKSLPASAEPGAWRALYTDPPQRQPLTDGWVAVPIEPTDEMLSVLVNIPLRPCVQPGGVTSIEAQGLNVVWSAMLDAAPKHGIGGEA